MQRPPQSRMQNQLTFIPWLINEINTNHHQGLEWIDERQQIARIPWPRARENLPTEDLGVIHCWHVYRFKDNYTQSRSNSTLKGTFRAIINSRDEITKLRDEDNMIIIQITHCKDRSGQDTLRTPVASPQNGGGELKSPPWSSPGEMTPVNSNPYEVATAPSWAQEILRQEQNFTDTSCHVFISVWSRGRLLCDKQADLQNGLLIYSDVNEVNFNMLTEENCNGTYGRGSKNADKLFISQVHTSGDGDLFHALRNFSKGILLSSDPFYNILAERLCAVRPYFGHSNQGGPKQMSRRKDQNWAVNPIYSYISFLEMAGYLMNMRQTGRPTNESDRPTAITYIAVGQEWTPSKPIQQLPLFIEIKHDRANNFQNANLNINDQFSGTSNETSAIVVSITNSLDQRPVTAVKFDDQMLSSIAAEMPATDFDTDEDMELPEISIADIMRDLGE